MFENAKRNLGLGLNYSQMNFLGRSGIEYGLGAELMFMNGPSSIQFLDSTNNYAADVLSIDPGFRKIIGTINIPIYAVYKIDLGDRLTLFPKAGINAKMLVFSDRLGTGTYQDSSNNVRYQIEYQTEDSRSNVMLNSAFGTSLGWKLKNGDLLTFNVMVNIQLTYNSLVSKITNIVYEKDDVVHFDSENFYPAYTINSDGDIVVNSTTSSGPVSTEHRTTGFTFGVAYTFKGGK
jgi:hypothetical protein